MESAGNSEAGEITDASEEAGIESGEPGSSETADNTSEPTSRITKVAS